MFIHMMGMFVVILLMFAIQLQEVQNQYEAAQSRLKETSQTQKQLHPPPKSAADDKLKDLQNQVNTSQDEVKGKNHCNL